MSRKWLEITAFELAQRFIGVGEISGSLDNPQIIAMLRLDQQWPDHDEVPWCSAFVNYVCWLLRLPRSKDLRARSWLGVGYAPTHALPEPGFDIVILKRGEGEQPGPEVLDAPGHVGFFAGGDVGGCAVLGGNQGNVVSIQVFPSEDVLGIRRLV